MLGARKPRLTFAVKLRPSMPGVTDTPARNEKFDTVSESSGHSGLPLTIGLSEASDL